MVLPDVNVLVYAFRADVPEHSISRGWLDGVISGEARFGLINHLRWNEKAPLSG